MEIKDIPISKLQTNNGQIEGLPKNPRLIKDDKFKQLVKSIHDDPEMLSLRECIVYPQNGHYVVIAGNMRLKACKELKYKNVPCKILPKETTIDKLKAYTIKDNIPFGENDWELLSTDWDTDQLIEWGMEVPDFVNAKETVEDDYIIPDEIETDIVLGDLFEIGQHRLLCGDSTKAEDVEKLMNGQKADMVFTDPPYGNNPKIGYGRTQLKGRFIANDETTETAVSAIKLSDLYLKNNNHFLSFIQWRTYSQLEAVFKELNFTIRSVIVWDKGNSGLGHGLVDQHEWIIVGVKGKATQRFYTGNLWSINRVQSKREDSEHPHKKPIELLSKGLDLCVTSNVLIYEPFLGSGSLMVACEQTNRKCYGMEIEPKYCQVIIDRMKKLDPNIEIKKNGRPYET